MTEPTELLPCPFCGAAAHFEMDEGRWEWVECESCGMQGNRSASLMEDCKPKLAEEWNQRTPPAVAGEPVFAFRRKGLDDFCTCTEERYAELSAKPNLFETRIFYTTPQPTQAQVGAVQLTCEWTHNADDSFWDTECGQSWRFDDGGPKENHMNFCHCCGKTLRIKGGQHGTE